MSALDRVLAHVALSHVVEPGSWQLWEALQRYDVEEVWERVRGGAPLGDLSQAALDGLAVRVRGYDPRSDLERLGDADGRVAVAGDPDWPAGLDWVVAPEERRSPEAAPPHLLYLRGPGELAVVGDRSVALVGSRAASPYGVSVATRLGLHLGGAGWSVVSGGAYGVDAAAHRGALEAPGSPTAAVLACGVDRAYPRGNERLLRRIAEVGLVVSEQPPGSAPTRVRFLVRNRLIAALTRGTVVVEAAARSGSLSTANHAVVQGKRVLAVPGPVTSAGSTGCHELIRSGKATLVTGAPDVLELVGDMGEHLLEVPRGPASPRDGLDEQVRRILDAVPVRVAAGVGSIGRAAGVSPLSVQLVLPQLLLQGLVEQRDGGWRLTALGAGR